MKRFWLLLLAFVLPLQMSWAAVHFCDADIAHSAGTTAPVAPEDSGRQAAKAAEGQVAEALADACCGASHGCHGLHNLMAPVETATGVAPSGTSISSAEVPLATSAFHTRHERPQWFAA